MSPTQETIQFKLEFLSVFWDQPPGTTILIDDEIKFDGLIKNPTTIISFDHLLNFGQHQLSIRRYNKTGNQVRINDSGQLEDQMLSIKKITIDNINIRNIIWCKSYNEPEYPELWASQQRAKGINLEKFILGETNFGHNCTWRLEFTSPFYQFIFDSAS